jgi:hypothetical protein
MDRYSSGSYEEEIGEGFSNLELNASMEETEDLMIPSCDFDQETPEIFDFTNDDISKVAFPMVESTYHWVSADGIEFSEVFGCSSQNLESIDQIPSIPESTTSNQPDGSDVSTNEDSSRPKRGRPKQNLKITVEELLQFMKQKILRELKKIEEAIEGKIRPLL